VGSVITEIYIQLSELQRYGGTSLISLPYEQLWSADNGLLTKK
jgi:hypothetical protein